MKTYNLQKYHNKSSCLSKAIQKHSNGHLNEAYDLYLEVIKNNNKHADALNLLGLLLYQKGSLDESYHYLSLALEVEATRTEFLYNLANTLKAKGLKQKAEEKLRLIISLDRNYFNAYLSLGMILEEQNKFDEALEYYHRATEIKPKETKGWFFLGNHYLQRKDPVKAIFFFRKAIQCDADSSIAYHGLGVAFKENSDHIKAIAVYRKAIELEPNNVQAHYDLGFSYYNLGEYGLAEVCFKKALSLRPDLAEAHQHLGDIYVKLGEYKKSISYYQLALEKNPNLAEAYYNLGTVYYLTGKKQESMKFFQRAVALKPTFEMALIKLATIQTEQGKFTEAEETFEQLLKYFPKFEYQIMKAMSHPIIYESKDAIVDHRRKFQNGLNILKDSHNKLEDPFKQVGLTNFILGMHGLKEKDIREQIARFFIDVCPDLCWQAPDLNKLRPGSKIRIGFLSRYLQEHTIGRLYHGIIEKLSKEKFHIIIFHTERQNDLISTKVNQSADEVIYLPKIMHAARNIIADQKLDLLFYPEIGMDPFTYFISFSRLAPVQCKRGFPITMGIPNIDYFISSEWAEPEDCRDHYSEKLILLKRTGYYYNRPMLKNSQVTRSEFDLPEGKKLYVCAQSLFKLDPEFDWVIHNIFQKDDHGILVLLKGSYQHWETLLMNRLKKTIPNYIERIRFIPRMPRDKFISLFLVADAVLDSIYISGGNTSLECFAFGIPVVTWASQYLPGRLTYGFYRQMGIMECVADNLEHYSDIAVRLANDKNWYAEIKKKIELRSHVLFEDELAINELESFFEWAVDNANQKGNNA